MNSRIQELIKQCETLDGDGDGYFTRFDKEKFAKLLLNECAKTIEDVHSKELGDYLKEVFEV